jgi:hypothetical protein
MRVDVGLLYCEQQTNRICHCKQYTSNRKYRKPDQSNAPSTYNEGRSKQRIRLSQIGEVGVLLCRHLVTSHFTTVLGNVIAQSCPKSKMP